MGADRLKKIRDAAKRGWNVAGQRLLAHNQLSLFDVDPTFARRSFRVLLKQSATVAVGEELLLHGAENSQFITRGPDIISDCTEIPASILQELDGGAPLCLEVVSVGDISNTIEVAPK